MKRSLAVALVVLASACSKKDSPSQAASGSAAGSGAPGSAGAVAPAMPAPAAPCTDDDIHRHIDDSLAVSLAYLDALEKKTAMWKQDCEAAKKDLLALEPDAQTFMDAMLAFKSWGQTLSESCRLRVAELGEKSAAAAEIEKRTPGLEAKVKPILERCQNHPGFADAAAKGLRVMRKK